MNHFALMVLISSRACSRRWRNNHGKRKVRWCGRTCFKVASQPPPHFPSLRSFIDAQVENKIQFLAKTSQIVEIPIASISRNQLLMKTYRSEIRKGVFHAKPIICKKLARQNINPEEIKLLRDELKTIRYLNTRNQTNGQT